MIESNQVCFTTLGCEGEMWSLDNYLTVGGYEAWRKILAGEWAPNEVIEEVEMEDLTKAANNMPF